MKKGLTEIIFVIDKSGSMESKKEDAMGGFNRTLDEQRKEDGEVVVTVTLFDTGYSIVHDGVPIDNVPLLTHNTYKPGGMTALLDAMGRTIDKVGERLAETAEDQRPEHVVMVIITDGLENASQEYTKKQVAERVERQQNEYKWTFLFLGADMAAIAEAQSMGIGHSIQGTQTGQQIQRSFGLVSQAICCVRKGEGVSDAWSSTSKTPN